MSYAIVKWKWGSLLQRTTDPATVQINDSPNPKPNATKGTPIPILQWKQYVRRINSVKSAAWLLKPDVMWINRLDEKCEPITCSGNFVQIIGSNATHYRLDSMYNDMNTATLDPQFNNWFEQPTLYFKATARGLWSGIFNVGKALDVFVPFLKARKHPYSWIRKSQVEVFPSLPFTLSDGRVVVRYELKGASVIGFFADGEYTYLRQATKPGECIHPTSWYLNTEGVKPPAVIVSIV